MEVALSMWMCYVVVVVGLIDTYYTWCERTKAPTTKHKKHQNQHI